MEIKNLNLIPEGDKPIIHASQFDENRSVRFDLKDGTEDYTLLADLVVTCNIKKVDGNIVTFEVENTESTYVVITLPLQATACAGPNIGEIDISYVINGNTIIIGSINFILEVEKSPMLGGIESASDIHDLEEQIDVIVTQIIATDYYTKTEVDNLLNDKADISDLPDMDNYYDKSSVDTLLNGKANVSDLNNYYNKSQVDNLLDDKADISDLPDMSDYYDKSEVNTLLANKADISDLPDMSNYYTKTEVDNKFLDIMPVNSASGSIANFTTSLALPLVALKSYITAQGSGGTPSAPVAITGFDSVKIYQRGVNLWDEEYEVGSIDTNTGNDTPSSAFVRSVNYNSCVGGASYYCYSKNGNQLVILWYDRNKTYISYEVATNSAKTSPANASFFRIRVLAPIVTGDVSINYPSTDTQYHAYNPNSTEYTIQLGQTCYGGYIDKSTGKLVITQIKEVLDGSENWQISTSNETTIVFRLQNAVANNISELNQMSNMFTFNSRAFDGTLKTPNIFVLGSSKTLYVQVSVNDFPDVTTFKTFLYSHNLEVKHEITPIEIDITLPDITALVGENNIFADSGDIDVSFKQDIQNYVDSKISAANANRSLALMRATVEESNDEGSER